MLRHLSPAVAAVALAASLGALPAQAGEAGVKAGILTCNVSSGWGLVFGSSRDLKCTYAPNGGGAEHYEGHIMKFGADIGYTAGGVIVWAVVAPTKDIGKGALAGNYAGVTGSATVGVGAGANVLVGGFKDSITLQPVSFEGNTGLNVAAGIAAISLDYKPQ